MTADTSPTTPKMITAIKITPVADLPEPMPVETAEPPLGGYPEEALRVLGHIGNSGVGQPLRRSDVPDIGPQWAADQIFYQIFPDSFARCEPVPTGEDFPAWGSEPDIVKPLGGNFAGIRSHLDHLSALGVNALYLCPIFHSNTCHRYNTYDYFSIDPRLGTLEDFRAFLDK